MDIPAYLVYILPIEESQVELHYPLSHIFHRQGRFSECPASASGAAEAGSRDTISSLSAGPDGCKSGGCGGELARTVGGSTRRLRL